MKTTEQRFWEKVDKRGPDECWPWLAGTCGRGGVHGQFWFRNRKEPAHRVAWCLVHGKLPTYTIDHLCRKGLCMNVSHMEDVTIGVNGLRGNSPFGINHRKTHCYRGHEFTTENTSTDHRGGRRCKACNRRKCREYHVRNREKLNENRRKRRRTEIVGRKDDPSP